MSDEEQKIQELFDGADRALMEVEAGGKRFSVHYLYTDVVLKRQGRWQIVGSQLVKPVE